MELSDASPRTSRRALRSARAPEDSGYSTFTPGSADTPPGRRGRFRDTIEEEMDLETPGASSSLLLPRGESERPRFGVALYSPIFAPGSPRTPKRTGPRESAGDRLKVKRQIFRRTSHKIGTPEKNRLLYPEIKAVTPPRRRRPSTPPAGPPNARDRVDFLNRLNPGHNPVLRKVFVHLGDEDLHNVHRVSRAWRAALASDRDADARRRRFARRLERNKENPAPAPQKKEPAPAAEADAKRPLADAQNRRNVVGERRPPDAPSPPVSPRSRNHRRFVKAASLGHNLNRCISCDSPAVLEGRSATCLACGRAFCGRCRYDFDHCEAHGCRAIEPASPPRSGVAAKVTKRGKSMRKSVRRLIKFDS